ncbi:hypothetical protein ABIE69_002083 [Rhodobacteraceae bacterium MBR-64]|jgi:hypothetical protein
MSIRCTVLKHLWPWAPRSADVFLKRLQRLAARRDLSRRSVITHFRNRAQRQAA